MGLITFIISVITFIIAYNILILVVDEKKNVRDATKIVFKFIWSTLIVGGIKLVGLILLFLIISPYIVYMALGKSMLRFAALIFCVTIYVYAAYYV